MIRFIPLQTALVERWRAGGADDYGLAPERAVSDGDGIPCRHCLKVTPAGADYLIVGHRPFAGLNPYTETGPIFVCAACERAGETGALPLMLASPGYIVRGYSDAERIVYGTGGVVPTQDIPARCEELLARADIAFVHVRSASNNCFQVRVDRA